MRMAASRGLPLKRVRKRGLQMIKQGMQFTILICLACGALAHGIERDQPGCAPKTPAMSDPTCGLRDVVGQSAAASGSNNCDSSIGVGEAA
jgi:hypothetical protein